MQRIEKVNESFKQANLECFDFTKSIQSSGVMQGTAVGVTSFQDLSQKFGHSPMVQERFKVESYLIMRDFPHSRDYILNRIKGNSNTFVLP